MAGVADGAGSRTSEAMYVQLRRCSVENFNLSDLNNVLANLAVTFANRARDARQAAADQRRKWSQGEARVSPEAAAGSGAMVPGEAVSDYHAASYGQFRDYYQGKIQEAERQAQLYEDRAAVARKGNFLARPDVEMKDPQFLSEFRAVIAACTQQGRLQYEKK